MSLALTLAFFPVVAADAAESSFAPSGVLAAPTSAAIIQLVWTPGAEAPDAYRVFALAPDGWRLLEERSASTPLTTQAPGGFADYGVAGVRDGIQSPIIAAAGFGNEESCIWIDTTPPGIGITCRPVRILRPSGVIGRVLP